MCSDLDLDVEEEVGMWGTVGVLTIVAAPADPSAASEGRFI